MKTKILAILLILTSLVGYLEWGGNNHLFLFQAEKDIILKLINDTASVMHPFVLLPLIGQIILALTLFIQKPSKYLTYIGMSCLGVLLMFMFMIGIISLNFKILLSSIPFLAVAVYTVIYTRKITT